MRVSQLLITYLNSNKQTSSKWVDRTMNYTLAVQVGRMSTIGVHVQLNRLYALCRLVDGHSVLAEEWMSIVRAECVARSVARSIESHFMLLQQQCNALCAQSDRVPVRIISSWRSSVRRTGVLRLQRHY